MRSFEDATYPACDMVEGLEVVYVVETPIVMSREQAAAAATIEGASGSKFTIRWGKWVHEITMSSALVN